LDLEHHYMPAPPPSPVLEKDEISYDFSDRVDCAAVVVPIHRTTMSILDVFMSR
jgi:hypothetical protein